MAQVRAASREWRHRGLKIGFVPTMGALHAGHLSLVAAVLDVGGADRVIASVFVNPTQFGPNEDLAAYPRDPQRDAAALRDSGVDLLFVPGVDAIYPSGSQTSVSVSRLPDHLCGLSRSSHFDGVATVVSLLFNIVEPDVAVFGEKDFQQLQVIRRLTRDLHFPIEILGAPIVREPDGLAMSSRNAYLSPAQRLTATSLYRSLLRARELVAGGETSAEVVRNAMARICAEAGKVDYIAIVDEETLEDLDSITGSVRAVLAVQVGPARLIDNMRLP